MHHTLIPPTERHRLHREYYLRVCVVSIVALAVALLIGCIGLFPAFIRAVEDARAAAGAVTADSKNNVTDSTLNAAKAELSTAKTLVSTLAADDAQGGFTDVIRSIVGVSNGVSLSGIDLSYADAKTVNVVVTGGAPTRDGLLAYRSRLETLFAGTKVDIPISALAKSANLAFNLRFTIKLP
jgi:hypothetical protein